MAEHKSGKPLAAKGFRVTAPPFRSEVRCPIRCAIGDRTGVREARNGDVYSIRLAAERGGAVSRKGDSFAGGLPAGRGNQAVAA